MNQAEAAEHKANFDRDGYVIIREFVTVDQVEEICRRAEAVTSKFPQTEGMFTNVFKGLERSDDFFKELLHNGAHVPILETLLGKKPEPTTASFFTKSKHAEEIHPHSDAMKGGVIWIAIDETNRENGCLHFIKGSHLREEEFAHLSASETNDLSEHPDLVEAAMKPGDIVMFRPTTVHWSGPNHEGTTRRGFNCFYVGDPSEWYKNLTPEQLAALKKKKSEAAAKATA